MELKQKNKTNNIYDAALLWRGSEKMRTAIYWDYQNVQLKSEKSSTILVDKILEYARSKGELWTLRAYANWSSPSIKAETAQNLTSAGFELIHVPSTRKNAVDLVISTDLGKATEDNIQSFIVITSDGDFIPALGSLRRAGKFTTIIAMPDVANERLLLAADEFYPLNRFQSSIPAEEFEDIKENQMIIDQKDNLITDAINLLRKAVLQCVEEDRSLGFSSVASTMYELDPNFSYKKIAPYKQFLSLATEAVKRGIVNIRDTEGWQELYIPELEQEAENEKVSQGRQLNSEELTIMRTYINELELDNEISLTKLLTKLRYARNRESNLSLTNSELKQLLVSMIEMEIFRKQDNGLYLLSPLWEELWENFSIEYRL